jgi:hypothetical protein
MKNICRIIAGTAIFATFTAFTSKAYSQTSGNLTFSCNSTAPSGNYGSKCVMAIWIENTQSPSVFIKTNAKYGHEDDHLTSWVPKSGSNTTDAVTGATLASNNTPSVIWNGTNVSKVVVADGTYKVFIEMGWGKDKVVQHSVVSFTFEKGPGAVHLTPVGNAYYSNVIINWVPLTTLNNITEDLKSLCVFPNPSNGIINLEIKQNLPSAQVEVKNSLGALVYRKNIEEGFVGIMNLDLNSFSNGLYFLKVTSVDQQYVYKIILQK